jgi:hypothetical protein
MSTGSTIYIKFPIKVFCADEQMCDEDCPGFFLFAGVRDNKARFACKLFGIELGHKPKHRYAALRCKDCLAAELPAKR